MSKTTAIVDLITFNNPVFETYVFWSAILILKMLFMSILTGVQRFKNKTIINPEDLHLMGVYKSMFETQNYSNLKEKLKLRSDDPDVERCRRAHRNDLENILPFLVVGLLYLMTNPDIYLAIMLYRAVGISRIIHTFVYALFAVRQPARAISFFICFGATVYMAIKLIQFTI